MNKKSPIKIKNETFGIYGYSDFASPTSNACYGDKKVIISSGTAQYTKRLILKTDNDKANDLSVNLRRSLLKKCQNLRIRTDIQAEGLYFVKNWLLRLIPFFEAELSTSSNSGAFEFASFSDDFLPFIAKNQFKSQIRKHAPLPKSGSIQEKVALIMNPMEMVLTKDHVKVLVQILPKAQQDFLFLPSIMSTQHYKHIDEICTTMQKQIAEGEIQVLAMSAIQKYLNNSSEKDSSTKSGNDDNATPSKRRDRAMSLRTTMEWGDGVDKISAANSTT